MQIIRSFGDACAAATDDVNPDLRQLISDTFARVADCPEILGYIFLVESGDTVASIDNQLPNSSGSFLLGNTAPPFRLIPHWKHWKRL